MMVPYFCTQRKLKRSEQSLETAQGEKDSGKMQCQGLGQTESLVIRRL